MNTQTYTHGFLKALGLLLIALPIAARAAVTVPAIFSDHMVLQSGVAVPVWGWAEPGEAVSVSFVGQTKSTTTDANGSWKVQLTALQPSEAQTLTVQGTNTITIQDVLVGEVWLGSGQSNMAFFVKHSNTFEAAQTEADLPQVRMFTVKLNPAPTLQADCTGAWVVCTPRNVGRFSAVLFYYGRELHQTLRTPVGLICAAVGGTPIENWMSLSSQQQSPELAQALHTLPAPETREDRGGRAELFNGMIAPLIPYALRGVVWYQGEANSLDVDAGTRYQQQLPVLVQDWRNRWGYDFPMAWVQLPNYGRAGAGWVLIREAMLKTLSLPKTGMAITVDLGDPNKIHPTKKLEVGHRLAAWALGTVYGKPVPATSGPLPAGHTVQGAEIALAFTHTDGGLVAKGGALTGFEVCGADLNWQPATARIEGTRVTVSSPKVSQPTFARYAWAANPSGNLYNGAGLPASPFRTEGAP